MSYTQPCTLILPVASLAATAGWVRKCCTCCSTFSSIAAFKYSCPNGAPLSKPLRSRTTSMAERQCPHHSLPCGNPVSRLVSKAPVTAPQAVWPQIITLVTFNTATAYSMAEVVPPVSLLCGGTTLPTLRKINKPPGSEPVTIFGSIRESEQVINKVSGD